MNSEQQHSSFRKAVFYKKLSYRRGAARHAISMEILSTAALVREIWKETQNVENGVVWGS